ncbi:hypothetical protein OpiT1DRAFT_03697 [Opitutaceae bacterium TAV1]|nr:hypothetical protein OpiT1DRAFT_03697 [Opitutaceae bacterium TAV1]
MKTPLPSLATLAALLVSATLSSATTLAPVRPIADTTIRAKENANPAQGYLLIGQTADANDYMRDLFSFSLPVIDVPDDKALAITSVSLVIAFNTNSSTTAGTYLTLDLHHLTTSFDSTATWSKARTDESVGVLWTTAGGDYDSTVLAQTEVLANSSAGTLYTWSGDNLTSVVNTAYAAKDTSINFLLKLANEGTDNVRRVVQLRSVDNTNSPAYPQLNITYELIDKPAPVVPEPAACAAIAGTLAALAALVIRRRR